MDRSHIRLLALGAVVAVAVAVTVVIVRGERAREIVLNVEPIDEANELTVYAGGAVAKPGLYTLPLHSRIATLLDQAGLLESAEQSGLQMAAELHDGQQVIVPTRQATDASLPPANTVAASPAESEPTPVATGPINVNSATEEELETLPGIGPALAQRILDYRNENGPFKSLDQLAEVKGISARMVDELRGLATVGS
ncbi:MAG TPA: ComEA family DNA-binding protein [Nitrolancea sp.]|nr:ComEA family DNA-binding protein [Nitrolancea sp.]